MTPPDQESRRLLSAAWKAYRDESAKLPYLTNEDAAAQSVAARAIVDAARKGRRIFIRSGFHEVIVHRGNYFRSGVKVSFACDRRGSKYVLDARTLFAPSPLELLAMQADEDPTSEHEPADE